jgi:hypothetical protein
MCALMLLAAKDILETFRVREIEFVKISTKCAYIGVPVISSSHGCFA